MIIHIFLVKPLPLSKHVLTFTGIDASSLASLSAQNQSVPQTYIVAQNPEVLAHLMKENENRGFSPSAYTTPASVFNTISVDFERKDDAPELVMKTAPIPVQSLQKLDPEVPQDAQSIPQAQPPPTLPDQTQMKQKSSRSLERTPSRSSTDSATPKMGSLERKSVDKSSSSSSSPKVNSLERAVNASSQILVDKTSMFSPKLGSLERKSQPGSPSMGSLERNAHLSGSPVTFSPNITALERSYAKAFDSDRIPNYHNEPTVYTITSSERTFEECIYDFGGVDVKSCAHKQPYFGQKSVVSNVERGHLEPRAQVGTSSEHGAPEFDHTNPGHVDFVWLLSWCLTVLKNLPNIWWTFELFCAWHGTD